MMRFRQKLKSKTHIQVARVQLHLLLQLSQQLVVEGLQLEEERRIPGDMMITAWPSDLLEFTLLKQSELRECCIYCTLISSVLCWSLKYQNIHTDCISTKWPNKLFGPRQRANFSNTSSIATCSPSPQAGSGSACGLQPSEKEPPLQREDKGKECKQKRGGVWRQKRITFNVSDHSARAASCKTNP